MSGGLEVPLSGCDDEEKGGGLVEDFLVFRTPPLLCLLTIVTMLPHASPPTAGLHAPRAQLWQLLLDIKLRGSTSSRVCLIN